MLAKFFKKNFWVIFCIVISVVIIGIGYFARSCKKTNEKPPIIVSESTLMKVIDISELSTAEYKFKGIATKYKNKKKKKVQCHIYYEAAVKAGIDMKEVKFKVDHENHIVKVKLPTIQVTLNAIDEKSLDTIPENPNVKLKTILEVCEKDLKEEVNSSTYLFEVAGEKLQATIEALIYPLLENEGYEIEWEVD